MVLSNQVEYLAKKISESGLRPTINMARPTFIQPEDRMLYRSFRVLLILNMLNTKNGLSKQVIACMDFLLRNPAYQKKFIIEYFRDKAANMSKKVGLYKPNDTLEFDFNIVQYKSVPWDLRFNDMFLFLHVRKYAIFDGERSNIRVHISEEGKKLAEKTKNIFIDETNFLELFGSRLTEDKTINIITEVIPNTYWKENEKFNY